MASIFLRTLIIYVLIAFALRIMGKRQIGELEVNELVSTLIISEIAALPIADPDIPLLNAVFPVIFIVSLEIITSSIKNKSEKIKKFIEGEPIFLIYKGKLCQKALKDNRISINELLCEARLRGVGNITNIYYAILEQNGQISVLEKGENETIAQPLIIDGELKEDNIKCMGYKKESVLKDIKKSGIPLKNVFLMTKDENGKINIIERESSINGD